MNKIILDEIIKKELDDSILICNNNEDIIIDVVKDTSLKLYINNCSNIIFNIKKGINLNLVNIINISGDISYIYNLDDNSNLDVQEYNNCNDNRIKVETNLNGIKSNFNYVLKTISSSSESYKIDVKHNAINTSSNIINHGVNTSNGNIIFDVSSYIPRDITGCYTNQVNRIINLTNNKCIIRPNLYIDCDDVVANHSAIIGKFSDDEMFYIESRGICEDDANSLLIRGFLFSNIEDAEIKDIIDEYLQNNWR